MLHFKKSQPAPQCLQNERKKGSSTNYRCGDVLSRLREDFKSKCYLCEQKNPTTINVEHFIPHKKDRDLMFNWDNLFWCCGHCNSIKQAKHINLLNCTDVHQQVEDKIRCYIRPYPREKASIDATDLSEETINTQNLLLLIFNGEIIENGTIIIQTTMQKRMESDGLRQLLQSEISKFQRELEAYDDSTISEDKDYYERKIRQHLNKTSAFTSFKRTIIRENTELMAEFGQYFTD